MKEQIKITHISKENVFRVPAQYFEELPLHIQNRIVVLNGIDGKEFLKEMVFHVPQTYFEQLPEHIQQKIAAIDSPVLENAKNINVFDVPENFFEQLSKNIEAKTSKKIDFQLDKISNQNVFQTPDNYFDALPTKIQQKIGNLSKNTFEWQNIFSPKLGTSLAFGMVILLGIYFYFYQTAVVDKGKVITQKQQNNSPKQIKEQAKIQEKNTEKIIDLMDEIVQEKKETKIYAQKLQKTPEFKPVKEVLEDTSKEELLAYLDDQDLEQDILTDLISEQSAEYDDHLHELKNKEEGTLLQEIGDEEIENLENILSNKQKVIKNTQDKK